MINRLLFWWGFLGVIAFILTGQYMGQLMVPEMEDAPRLFYRSAHVYILLAAVLCMFTGYHFKKSDHDFAALLQKAYLLLITISLPLFLYAFFIEDPKESFDRLWSHLGAYALIAAAVVLCLVSFIESQNQKEEEN